MNKIVVFLITIAFGFTCTGCWDVRDISNRAFVTAVGLDASAKGYRMSVAIPRPSGIRNRSTQDYGQVLTAEAESISEAVSLLQSELSRDIYFSHIRVLMVGEKLARQSNFNDLVSFFGKSPNVALRFRLVFVDGGEAGDVLKTLPLLDRSIATEVIGLSESGKEMGIVRSKKYYDFLSDLRQTDGNALGSRIVMEKVAGKPALSSKGGAIFTDWRLAGWLNSDEMEDANWILKLNPNVTVVSRMDNGQFSCMIDKKRVRISPRIDNGQLKFEVKIKAVGRISEQQHSSLDLTEPKNLEKLQAVIREDVIREASEAMKKSQQELGIDYLGFDRALLKNEPQVYKKLNWPGVYPSVPVDIKFDFHLDTVGLERR